MTEIDKNVLKEVENNQKVEVVVKRESENGTAELDLVRVFSNMGKKKRVYAWVLIICMLVGLSVPMLMAELKDKTESVSAVITFLYDGAKLEQAPDETPLDINYITSSYILQNAINRTCLSENITVSSLERNMGIERLLTENTRQDLEVMEKVINEGKTDYDAVRDVIYQYDGKYILTLDNGFSSDPEAKNKVFLKGDELSNLLNNVIESYNEYFYETYMDMTLPDNNLDSISIEDHDYIEKLDEMVTMLNSLSEYCHDKDKEDFYEIRSKKDGMSFRDIDDCIRLIKDIDIDYLYAYVFYNGIAKDKKSMMTKYEFQLKNSQRELNVVEGNIKNN
ncbi:MAG: hypothetical protein K6G24_09115, partial [Lachnospiraceae bacterium]|nr:hypothetical protein [Lachnospiraceae bacterium]